MPVRDCNICIASSEMSKSTYTATGLGLLWIIIHIYIRATYRVLIHDFRKAWISGAMLFGEVVWLQVFYSTLCLQTLWLQLFLPISQLIRRSPSAVYLSLLTPSILCHGHCVKSLAKARKSLRGSRKLSRRSTMTRPWRECRYKCFI